MSEEISESVDEKMNERRALERATRERIAVAEIERELADAARFQSSLGRLLEMAAAAQQEAMQLPCYPGASQEPPDILSASDACAAADGWSNCRRAGQPHCPRQTEMDQAEAFVARAIQCRIPGAVKLRDALRLNKIVAEDKPSVALLLASERVALRDTTGRRLAPGSLRDSPSLLVVRSFLRQQAPGAAQCVIVLGGDLGVGKTVAACSSILERSILFVTPPELAEIDPPVTAKHAMETPMLVLDDLGSEREAGTGYAVDTVVEVLTRRIRERRPTIITTNLTPPQIKQRFGPRLYDRLRECARFAGFAGPSLRGQK